LEGYIEKKPVTIVYISLIVITNHSCFLFKVDRVGTLPGA